MQLETRTSFHLSSPLLSSGRYQAVDVPGIVQSWRWEDLLTVADEENQGLTGLWNDCHDHQCSKRVLWLCYDYRLKGSGAKMTGSPS
jgi:hypothetical protein